MPFNLGMTELLVILALLLLVFGAKRLPEIGSSMGKGIREFKKSISEMRDSIDENDTPAQRKLDAPKEGATRDGEPKKLSE
jgi:sec-independent protein translocase protein TatA